MRKTKRHIRALGVVAISLAASPLLCSCFTGVESTPKVTISRGDMRQILSHREDSYLDTVRPTALKLWKPGKRFYVSDDRVVMTFLQQGLPLNDSEIALQGRELLFDATEDITHPDGSSTLAVVLTDGERHFRFDTGRRHDEAMEEFDSYDMEMLVDMDAVAQVDSLMRGHRYWTRTPLWYDADDTRLDGRKFVPVEVDSVTVGNMIFPLKVWFTDERGVHAQVYMNLKGTGSGSRSFANLFYLNDLKQRYPKIEPEVWQLIQRGQVREGMTKEECRLSLGWPANIDSGTNNSYMLDLWRYDGGKFLRFVDGLLTQYRL